MGAVGVGPMAIVVAALLTPGLAAGVMAQVAVALPMLIPGVMVGPMAGDFITGS